MIKKLLIALLIILGIGFLHEHTNIFALSTKKEVRNRLKAMKRGDKLKYARFKLYLIKKFNLGDPYKDLLTYSKEKLPLYSLYKKHKKKADKTFKKNFKKLNPKKDRAKLQKSYLDEFDTIDTPIIPVLGANKKMNVFLLDKWTWAQVDITVPNLLKYIIHKNHQTTLGSFIAYDGPYPTGKLSKMFNNEYYLKQNMPVTLNGDQNVVKNLQIERDDKGMAEENNKALRVWAYFMLNISNKNYYFYLNDPNPQKKRTRGETQSQKTLDSYNE